MDDNQSPALMDYLDYRDILIALGTWYFTAVFNLLSAGIVFAYSPLTHIFHFLFIVAGRVIFLALMLFYLTSFYPVTFKELGFRLNDSKKQIIISFSLIFFLLAAVTLLINLPLSFSPVEQFTPLYHLKNPEVFINSLVPLALLFTGSFFIGLSQLFLLVNYIYKLFDFIIFNHFISVLMTSLFYSILLLEFSPGDILINFITALICLLVYYKTESLLTPSLFLAGYYAIYIAYIYGWGFIRY